MWSIQKVNQGLHCAQNGDKSQAVQNGNQKSILLSHGWKNITLYGVADALWKPSLINEPTTRVVLAQSSIFYDIQHSQIWKHIHLPSVFIKK